MSGLALRITIVVALFSCCAPQNSLSANTLELSTDSWVFYAVEQSSQVTGFFAWHRETPGQYAAFYFQKDQNGWHPYLYPNESLGWAVVKAEEQFQLGAAISKDPTLGYFATQAQQAGNAPSTSFIAATNGIVAAFHAAGFLGSDPEFPVKYIGSESSDDLGVLELEGLPAGCGADPNDPQIEVLGATFDQFLYDRAHIADYGETQLPDGTTDLIPDGPSDLYPLVDVNTNCGLWQAPVCVYSGLDHMQNGQHICTYISDCTQTRRCTKTLWLFDCQVYNWSTTETKVSSHTSVACMPPNGAPCPPVPAPPATLPPPGCTTF